MVTVKKGDSFITPWSSAFRTIPCYHCIGFTPSETIYIYFLSAYSVSGATLYHKVQQYLKSLTLRNLHSNRINIIHSVILKCHEKNKIG